MINNIFHQVKALLVLMLRKLCQHINNMMENKPCLDRYVMSSITAEISNYMLCFTGLSNLAINIIFFL